MVKPIDLTLLPKYADSGSSQREAPPRHRKVSRDRDSESCRRLGAGFIPRPLHFELPCQQQRLTLAVRFYSLVAIHNESRITNMVIALDYYLHVKQLIYSYAKAPENAKYFPSIFVRMPYFHWLLYYGGGICRKAYMGNVVLVGKFFR